MGMMRGGMAIKQKQIVATDKLKSNGFISDKVQMNPNGINDVATPQVV